MQRMTAREFSFWIAFHDIQPFGEDAEEHRMAYQTASLLQVKTKKHLRVKDFRAHQRKEKKQSAAEQQSVVMEALAQMKVISNG